MPGARKVTIYTKKDIFWTILDKNLSLIELKRFDSTEWEELSAKPNGFKSVLFNKIIDNKIFQNENVII